MTTSNERLQEVIKVIAEKTPDPKYDLVVTSPATGNKDYIEWVKSQTITHEAAEKAAQKDKEIPDSLAQLASNVMYPSYWSQ